MIYLSHFLNSKTPCYGGNSSQLKIESVNSISAGQSSNSFHISMSNHVGTHIDFPRHFDNTGRTLSDYAPEELSFSSPQIIDLPCPPEHMISIEDLEGKVSSVTDFLILRTTFEGRRHEETYWKNNPGILPEVGLWMRKSFSSLRAIGFDFISLSCYQKRELGREAHRAFLGPLENHEPILILEDMRLAHIYGPLKQIIIAPLLIESADGVPVTVIAV